ncbi:hypothetical protein DNHGIG_04270 [Collibacillus ludicampi]|uniref:Protein BatD n=1 Tax=Collibacillus ludicampi TaxID=2771369 RepID=A0AAV4LB37_9BACL|nr:hypothetical protein [Collibacillus ludicampi]GIM44878.1 hypothetical protein DNHGIG_04270 [Collibacillus ludicampi]
MRLNKWMRWLAFLACMFSMMILSSFHPVQAESSVRVKEDQIVVVPVANHLQVMQIMTFENTGKQPLPTLEIDLPKGFRNIEFYQQEGENHLKTTSTGILDESGLTAGEKQISFSYQIPLEGISTTLTVQTQYPIDVVYLIVPQGRLSLSANNVLPQSESIDFQGQKLRRFTRPSLEPGVEWPIHLIIGGTDAVPEVSGRLSGGTTSDGLPIIGYVHNETTWKALGNLLLVIAVLAFGMIGVQRTRSSRFHKEVDAKPLQSFIMEKKYLMEQMVLLERDYRSGLITETTYQEMRADLKSRMVVIQMKLTTHE